MLIYGTFIEKKPYMRVLPTPLPLCTSGNLRMAPIINGY